VDEPGRDGKELGSRTSEEGWIEGNGLDRGLSSSLDPPASLGRRIFLIRAHIVRENPL
jgi:hypothetical protein